MAPPRTRRAVNPGRLIGTRLHGGWVRRRLRARARGARPRPPRRRPPALAATAGVAMPRLPSGRRRSAGGPPQERDRPMRVAAQQMHVPRAHLRQPLEQLLVAGPLACFQAVSQASWAPKKFALAPDSAGPPLVVLLDASSRRSPAGASWVSAPHGERAAELVARPLGLLPRLGGYARLAGRFLRHARRC